MWLPETTEIQTDGLMVKLSMLKFTTQQEPQGDKVTPLCPSELLPQLLNTPNPIPEPNVDASPSHTSDLRAFVSLSFQPGEPSTSTLYPFPLFQFQNTAKEAQHRTTKPYINMLFSFSFFFKAWSLSVSWLSWNLLCRPGWPQAQRDPSASVS